jgi:inorganic triphosphatase YgiF
MSDPREIEAKFEADEETIAAILDADHAGTYALRHTGAKVQNDLYFDTGVGHLKAAGCSLRIRRKSDASEMTFKGDRQAMVGDVQAVSRLEDEVTLPPGALTINDVERSLQMDDEPSPLLRAREIAGDQALVPIARLLTDRTIVMASSDAGASIEMAVDRCQAERLSDGRRVHFVEIEIELKSGSFDDLVDAINELRSAFAGLRPSAHTKLERALE